MGNSSTGCQLRLDLRGRRNSVRIEPSRWCRVGRRRFRQFEQVAIVQEDRWRGIADARIVRCERVQIYDPITRRSVQRFESRIEVSPHRRGINAAFAGQKHQVRSALTSRRAADSAANRKRQRGEFFHEPILLSRLSQTVDAAGGSTMSPQIRSNREHVRELTRTRLNCATR